MADAHAVFVPRPVRYVRNIGRHAARRRGCMARHGPFDLPFFNVDDGPNNQPRAVIGFQGRPAKRRTVFNTLTWMHVQISLLEWRPCARSVAWTYSARSEEHTSELQSLMRISYAVFFLKIK